MELIDITVPIRPGMPVYEGDPDVQITRTASIASGDLSNLSRLDLGAHTGTHIDAPGHLIDGAAGVEAVSLDALIGDAYVVDATGVGRDIDAAMLRGMGVPANVERVLFKTPNSRLWERGEFSPDFVGLEESAARVLLEGRVRLVGIDYLSIAPMANPASTHLALLEAGVVILEGLDLRQVEPGPYRLICLPLNIPGCDGAPARAVLERT